MPIELLCVLLGLVALLAFIAVLGHGLWLLIALVWRLVFWSPPAPGGIAEPRRLESCVCCGNAHPAGLARCPFCSIPLQGPAARELRELEATARRVQAFLDADALDRATSETVYRCIERRQRELILDYVAPPQVLPVPEEAPPAPQPVAATPVHSPVPLSPPQLIGAVELPPEPVAPAPPTPAPEPIPIPPPPPRRPLGELLAAFMEESNILWGELVGGLLIVGCSIALVISLWRTLKQIPFFPFLLLSGLTALLFGAGLYTLRHWKLATTSRGLLVIALLLVPLDFLVLANLSQGVESGVLELVTAVAAVAGFTALVRLATPVLVGSSLSADGTRSDWLVTLAVIGASAAQLLVAPLLGAAPPATVPILLLGLLPAACHAVALGLALVGLHRQPQVSSGQASPLFGFLGISTFSLIAALGFLLYWNDAAPVAAQALALPVAISGLPLLAAGALLRKQLEPSASSALRIGGTVVTLTGGVVLLVAVAMAWPSPLPLIATACVGAAAFLALAIGHRLPLAHLPGLVFLTIAYLTAFHLLAGELTVGEALSGRLLQAAISPDTGIALVLLAVVLVGTAELLARSEQRIAGQVHAAFAGGLAALSLAAVTADAASAPGRAALVYLACVILAVATNLRWRLPYPTFAAAVVLLGALFHGLTWAVPELALARRAVFALLASATIALLVREMFRRTGWTWAGPAFVIPLTTAVPFATDLAALVLALAIGPGWFVPASLAALWLAGLWLVLVEVRGGPGRFTAFQAALTLAVGLAVTAWLERQPWLAGGLFGLLDPRSLQAYGLALAALGLSWTVVRVLRRRRPDAPALPEWSDFPAFDRIVTGLLVVGHLALAGWAILPELHRELAVADLASTVGGYTPVFGWPAWTVTAFLTVGLVVGLWERPSIERLLGLVLLAVTASVLTAGAFRDERAAASALRWGLAGCFLICSALLWWRDELTRLAARLHIPPNNRAEEAEPIRVVLGICTLPVVLLLTFVAVTGALSGQPPIGPMPESFFARIGWLGSQLIPLVLVIVGLSGDAVRERSPGHAFAAGLLAVLSVLGGRALAIHVWDQAAAVQLLQLATATASVWAIGWLAVRPWVAAWRETPERPTAAPLMLLQLGLCAAGNAVLLGVAIAPLIFGGPSHLDPGPAPPFGTTWTLAAGSLLGWIAFALAVVAVSLHVRANDLPGMAHRIAVIVLTLVALYACFQEGRTPGTGYHVLLIGWAGCLLFGSAVVPRRERDSDDLLVASEIWGITVGLVVAALAVKAAVVHRDYLWAAGGLAIPSVAAAVMAYNRRREAWAFVASLGVNATVSMAVWYAHDGLPLSSWWVTLAHANLLTVGVTSWAWLTLHRWTFGTAIEPLTSPLMLLVTLPLIGHGFLLTPPLMHLLADPAAAVPARLIPHGHWIGTLALLLNLTAAFRCYQLALPRVTVHIVAVGGLLLGVTAAWGVRLAMPGTMSGWSAWLPHHVLTLAWTLLALVILTSSWAGTLPRVGPMLWSDERRKWAATLLGQLFPMSAARRWVELLGVLVIALALRGAWGDPTRPYLSCAAVLAVSVLYGAMALWSRGPWHVYASGLLFTLVGYLVWQSWLIDTWGVQVWLATGPGVLDVLFCIQILCLAMASTFWTTVDLQLRRRTPPIDLRGYFLPFSFAAALLALHLSAILILGALAADVMGENVRLGTVLPWLALVAAAGSLIVCLWDFEAVQWAMPVPPLYALGLLAVGLGLHQAAPLDLRGPAILSLAAYALATCLLGRFFWSSSRTWTILNWPNQPARWPTPWFLAAQTLIAVAVVGLSVNVCLTAATTVERLAGPMALVLLGLAGLLLIRERSAAVRDATLGLAVLTLTATGWALLDPSGPAPWLHRNVVLMVALGLSAVGCVFLSRWRTDWHDSARRVAAVLGPLAAAWLAVVLVHEFILYDPVKRATPLAAPAIVVVALTLTLILAALLYLALTPQRDPLGPTTTGRVGYVYAAEVLLVLLLIHLRLCIPDIFPPALGRYWPLTVMVVAFLGVGLGELFERRVPVLASPLRRTGVFLPLLPLLAYFVRPLAAMREQLGAAVPGLQPFLRFLERMPEGYAIQAMVWFLVGLLYMVLAVRQRSSRFGILAALAANFGLWVLLGNADGMGFFSHPQLWLIPLGLILLVSEWLHREELSASQSQALRVGGALLIYVASTADMFIAGLGQSLLMPLTLAVLSIFGVLLGILLRVRAFLFLGATFLFLVVFAQIWHAAVDRSQTWLWWACGIVLGMAILALFALFEKRRNEVLQLVENLRRWD